MSDASNRVHCDRHSETVATFVCRHVGSGVACGFHTSVEDPADPWPDAWCDGCQVRFERDGEWNERNAPELALLCTGCYEEARARNAWLPAPLKAKQLSVSETQFEELKRRAAQRAEAHQEATRKNWPLFGSAQRWEYDDVTRVLRFFDEPTGPQLLADALVVGSWSTRSGSWMWTWANGSYSELERAAVDCVRVFGEVRGVAKLSSGAFEAAEAEGWELTQVAADLLGSSAVYRAPMDHLSVFMLLDNFRVQPALSPYEPSQK